MSSTRIKLLTVFALCVCSGLYLLPSALVIGFAQTRDTPAIVSGTARISGSVVTNEANGRPVRRALVTLTAPGRGGGANTVVTDDAGRFVFTGLAAGRYTLSASRPGFPNASYGATRPARPGTPVQLTDGQQVNDLVIRMWRGAVITGTISDQNGEPLPAARVTLLKWAYAPQNGQRSLQPSGGTATTDDRGVYRIYGIIPGQYFVQLGVPFSLPGTLRLTTDQTIQSATQPSRANSQEGPTVAFAPIFYPSATSVANATPVTVAAGEERTGIDMQLQLVPTARIEGVVVNPDGTPSPGAQLSVVGTESYSDPFSMMMNLGSMFGSNRPKPDGSFSLPGIAPGQYTVVARTGGFGRMGAPAGVTAAAPSNTPALWATAEVTVNGLDVGGVRLQLEPGVVVSGRLAFEAGAAPAPDPSTIRVSLSPILTGGAVAVVTEPAPVDAQGRFTFANVTPGRYRFSAGPNVSRGMPVPAAGPWALKSALVKGRDALDAGLEVKPGETIADITLTFTDRPTTLTGTLQDGSGRPPSDYFIILYATDRSLWTPPSRRVVMARPANDGKFSLRNVPAGEYLLAAATDVDQGEWMDPAFLAQFVQASIKVSLVEGETKSQDIRIAGGR